MPSDPPCMVVGLDNSEAIALGRILPMPEQSDRFARPAHPRKKSCNQLVHARDILCARETVHRHEPAGTFKTTSSFTMRYGRVLLPTHTHTQIHTHTRGKQHMGVVYLSAGRSTWRVQCSLHGRRRRVWSCRTPSLRLRLAREIILSLAAILFVRGHPQSRGHTPRGGRGRGAFGYHWCHPARCRGRGRELLHAPLRLATNGVAVGALGIGSGGRRANGHHGAFL